MEMNIKIKTWLTDIKIAIVEINSFFFPDKKEFSSFQKDIKTKRAVERNIEIIGEALNRIIKLNPEIPITNIRRIIDTRNRIIRGYDSVSEEILWAIIIKELPLLEQEIDVVLKQYL